MKQIGFGLEIKKTQNNKKMILGLTGVVDVYTVPMLKDLLLEQVDADGVESIVVDLSGVKEINSIGFGALIQVRKAAEEKRKELFLTRPTPEMSKFLNITGLHRIVVVREAIAT